ncbi:hypothetical protein AVEN_69016-1 [Araneus ventricosus]|uniref:Uncharacterized protein n=1 Tax=Araneus ventricosus TaxID=182803 RepID=A0A4Y2DAZ8_ARAVE|nr:hypothetical protein AVEN_69016-1 [Araneus ventricosus]
MTGFPSTPKLEDDRKNLAEDQPSGTWSLTRPLIATILLMYICEHLRTTSSLLLRLAAKEPWAEELMSPLKSSKTARIGI